MKQLKCEMCGGTDLIKQDGVFVCQTCGVKYSVEEAKNMMVEIEGTVEVKGTVKIDTSDELANLYQIARRAKNDNNSESAAKYYDMILIKDPTSWEASFYIVYFKAMECRIAEIQSAGISVSNCIDTVLELIKNHVLDKSEQQKAYTEVANSVLRIAEMLYDSATNYYEDIDWEIKSDYTQEWLNNCFAAMNCAYFLGDSLELFFSSDSEANNLSVTAWNQGVTWHQMLLSNLADQTGNKKVINDYREKIKKYASSHSGSPEDIAKELLRSGYGNRKIDAIKILRERTGLGLAEAKDVIDKVFASAGYGTYNPNQNSGGCYVATCVYGSYDCPQVWTLRRYRDNTLASTWYGRAFIHTYYAISPTIVKCFGNTQWFKNLWKNKLDKMVSNLQTNGVEDTPYQDKNWR